MKSKLPGTERLIVEVLKLLQALEATEPKPSKAMRKRFRKYLKRRKLIK
jgi:hypothetical protein